MTVLGILLIAEAIVTVAWREPFSSLLGPDPQESLAAELRRYRAEGLGRREARRLAELGTPEAKVRFLAKRLRAEINLGAPVGRLVIGGSPWIT